MTLALAYGVFIAAERLFHVSGVVAVLASGLTVSALGRSRIAPYNWSFLTDLWDQIAFWARSLVFILASILVPRLLGDVGLHDLLLVAVLVAAAFAARILVLVRAGAAARVLRTDPADQLGIQAGDHLGRIARGADPGAGSGGDREFGAQSGNAAVRRGARYRPRAVHAVRQRHNAALGDRLFSGSTDCRRETRSCATKCWRSPMPRFAIRFATWRNTTRLLKARSSRSSNRTKPGLRPLTPAMRQSG